MMAIARHTGLIVRLVVVCAVVETAALCRADTLVLQSGGLVRGRLTDSPFLLGSKPVVPAEQAPSARKFKPRPARPP